MISLHPFNTFLFKSLGVSVFALVACTLSGCDSADTPDTSRAEQSKVGEDPVSCASLPYTTVDEQLQAGMDLVYGRVEQVEPVLDAFIDADSGDSTVHQRCDGQVTPAIRIQLQVEKSSWDHTTDTPLTITLEAEALHQSEFQPSVAKDGDLQWAKDPEFLAPGATVAFGGPVVDRDAMVTKLTGVYPLDNGKIAHDFDADNRCKTDDFVDRDIDELIEKIRATSDTRTPVDMSKALHLFSSHCLSETP